VGKGYRPRQLPFLANGEYPQVLLEATTLRSQPSDDHRSGMDQIEVSGLPTRPAQDAPAALKRRYAFRRQGPRGQGLSFSGYSPNDAFTHQYGRLFDYQFGIFHRRQQESDGQQTEFDGHTLISTFGRKP
jgi:hypothetical protein